MQIVAATADDAEAISQVAKRGYADTFGHLYTPENLSYHLDKTCSPEYFRQAMAEGDVILLAKVGGAVAGYVKAGRLGLPVDDSQAMELHRLYVLEPYQGRAIGKALMEAALARPPLEDAKVIYLGVWENNLKAQAFYARYGFVEAGEYTYWVGSHADRELIYKRDMA